MEKPKGSLISFMANKVKLEGGTNLAQGIPAFSPPKELLQILSKTVFENFHQYAPGKGNALLLDQLSLHYGIDFRQFLIVNGATEAISTIITYLLKEHPGAAVFAFSPVYESYKNIPRIFNVPFFSSPLTNSIDFEDVESVFASKKIRIILLASPGNPLGRVYTKTEIDRIIELAEKYEAYVIIDAVYAELYFSDEPYYPTDNISENVFYVNAFSKKLSITGWRIGYLVAHLSHMDALMDIHDYIGLSSSSVLQQALAIYLRDNKFGNEYSVWLRDNLKQNYIQLATALNELGFKVFDAQGGYFIWCELPQKYDSGLEFTLDLFEKEKVAVVPGIHFDEKGERMVRLNIARHPYEISMAVSKIKNYIQNN